MPTRQYETPDALAAATRDISRHISGLADELIGLHHNPIGDRASQVDRTLDKMRDQIALLTAVVNDLARVEHQA